jgi:hypothetical protein
MPHVDDLLGYASVAAAALATAAVMSSACDQQGFASTERVGATAIVRLQPVEVVARRSTELARIRREEVAARVPTKTGA